MIKTRMFAAFGLGAITATISLGAVQYVSANGGSSITACANKSTGIMRYLTKGSCKKTETKVTWNQQGQQGTQGPTGPQGVGTSGTNGQNLFAVDNSGRTVGPIRGMSLSDPLIEFQGRMFSVRVNQELIFGWGNGSIQYYKDSQCTQPYINLAIGGSKTSQGVAVDPGTDENIDASDKAYIPVGDALSFTGRSVYTMGMSPCAALTSQQKTANDSTDRLFDVQEISKPTYLAPLTIVSR